MERWSQAMPSRRAVLALGSATALTAGLPHLAKAQARVADDPAMIAAAKQEGRVTVYANSDQAVTNRLVPQHARPARAQHHRHLAGGHRARLEVGQCGIHRLVHVGGELSILEIAQADEAEIILFDLA